eukprot:1430423-Amphidinium_carterae.1
MRLRAVRDSLQAPGGPSYGTSAMCACKSWHLAVSSGSKLALQGLRRLYEVACFCVHHRLHRSYNRSGGCLGLF